MVTRIINDIEFAVKPEESATLLCNKTIAEITKGDIYTFIEYLYDVKKEYTPMVATWEITNVCNFECKFCYINTSKKGKNIFHSFKDIKSAIDDLVDYGLLLVYLTGGEVLTHPDFEKIYTYLKTKGVFVVILTNLSLLNEQHIELFKKYPPLRITASIYAMSSNSFKTVTGLEGEKYKKVIDNVIKLKDAGINISCQTPINQLTKSDYMEIASWCYENKIIYKSDYAMEDSYYGEQRANYSISKDEFQELKKPLKFWDNEIILDNTLPEKKFGYKTHFDCISGKHTFAISYDLVLRPCFSIYEGIYQSFDGKTSMRFAIERMRKYINDMKNKRIDYCNGCEAHSICSECLLTQNKNKGNIALYMKKKCLENKSKLMEIISHDK